LLDTLYSALLAVIVAIIAACIATKPSERQTKSERWRERVI